MLRPLITIGCMTVAGAVAAEPTAITGKAIKETFSGSLLEIDTPLGSKIPVRFSKNGLVSGEAGMLAGMLGAAKDRGRWWTKDDELCIKWFRWFEAKPKCAALRQDGARIYWSERGGESGTATLHARANPAATPKIAKAVETPKLEQPEQPTLELNSPAPQQVADASAAVIMQRPASTTSPDDRPALMFAGMTGLQGVAITAPARESNARQPMLEARTPPAKAEPVKVSTPSTQSAEPTTRPAPQVARTAETRAAPDESAAMQTSSTLTTASFRVAGVRSDDMLNVRSGPSEYHQLVGRIPPAARGVKIIGACRGEWCPIRRGRVSGWVNSYYLAEETSSSAAGGLARR